MSEQAFQRILLTIAVAMTCIILANNLGYCHVDVHGRPQWGRR